MESQNPKMLGKIAGPHFIVVQDPFICRLQGMTVQMAAHLFPSQMASVDHPPSYVVTAHYRTVVPCRGGAKSFTVSRARCKM